MRCRDSDAMPMWRGDGGGWLIRCIGERGVSNRVVQMQYRYSAAMALASWGGMRDDR